MKSPYYLILLISMTSCASLYRDTPVNPEPAGEISSVRGYRLNQDGLVLSLHQDSYPEKACFLWRVPGFTVHCEEEKLPLLKNLFKDWYRGGANWYMRDSNSVFVRFGENPETDKPYLFPGIGHDELIRLTEEKGVIFWMSYPSLFWISARDAEALSQACENNETLKILVKRVACNRYDKNSWYNAAGYPLDFDFTEYGIQKKQYGRRQREIPEAGKSFFSFPEIQPPSYYLNAGPRSKLDESYAVRIRDELSQCPHTAEGLIRIMHWVNENFQSGLLGDDRITVNDFFKYRMIQGCRTNALVLAAVLRALDIPAAHISTVDLPTARQTEAGESIASGHDMVEAYIGGRWYLLDGSGRVSESYNPLNPYIIRLESENGAAGISEGFVIARGLDNWDYGYFEEGDYRAQCSLFLQALRGGELDSFLVSPSLVVMVPGGD